MWCGCGVSVLVWVRCECVGVVWVRCECIGVVWVCWCECLELYLEFNNRFGLYGTFKMATNSFQKLCHLCLP